MSAEPIALLSSTEAAAAPLQGVSARGRASRRHSAIGAGARRGGCAGSRSGGWWTPRAGIEPIR